MLIAARFHTLFTPVSPPYLPLSLLPIYPCLSSLFTPVSPPYLPLSLLPIYPCLSSLLHPINFQRTQYLLGPENKKTASGKAAGLANQSVFWYTLICW